MSNILSFEFEELPLVIYNGIQAGLINGCAEIRYGRHRDWCVESVSIEGWQELTQAERDAGKRPWVYVPATDEIVALVVQRLEGEWASRVCDAVTEQLAMDREAEYRADMRREERMLERF